ncbi:hypothetical protein [Helicobacter himalayensis]|uniref:hypothetical protein n=1 Tax=Helicobacter himalayensis TaxID=1591088 RepID=UPI0008333B5E|nr:hypothetical protein [Helicobacter himalayensis]
MKQRVHFLTYLVKNTIYFTKDINEAVVVIPENAEVTHISFEVEEANAQGSLADIGYANDPTALASGIDCSVVGTHIINKVFTTTKNEEIWVRTSVNRDVGGGANLRIAYYLPSTTILEL